MIESIFKAVNHMPNCKFQQLLQELNYLSVT